MIAAAGVAALVLPGNMSGYVELVKSLELPLWVLAPAKMSLVFPVVYHAINGVRHLVSLFFIGFILLIEVRIFS